MVLVEVVEDLAAASEEAVVLVEVVQAEAGSCCRSYSGSANSVSIRGKQT